MPDTLSGTKLLTLAEAAYAVKNYAEALLQTRAALKVGSDVDAYESERGIYEPRPETSSCELLIGVLLHESGESDAAIEHLDRAVELDRENMRPWGNRGHVRRERGSRLRSRTCPRRSSFVRGTTSRAFVVRTACSTS